VPLFLDPSEDAVILFQYSRNLAETAAITFIRGGVHAEGATDFAWMLFLSLGMKLGIAAFWLVAVVNFASLFALGVLLLKIAETKVSALPLLFIAGCFGLMPQVTAAATGFSVLPFAVLMVLMTYRFLQRDDIGTPAAALALCLFRPDGVVFAVPLLIAALINYPDRWRRLRLDAAIFIVPGLIYFFWRWHYFGHFLPLTFMVKADAPRSVRFFGLFVFSSLRQIKLLYFFVFGALAILWSVHGTRLRIPRNRSVLICLVTLPTLLYLSLRLDQNIGHRFYIYLPVGIAVLIAMNWQSIRSHSGYLLRASLVCWFFFPFRIWADDVARVWPGVFDTRMAVAKELGTLPNGSMIVTEAGILPYYSRWTAYDAWGLNTATFAERLFQPPDVAKLRPDLMLVLPTVAPSDSNAVCTPRSDWQTPYKDRTWTGLTRNMIAGIAPGEYDLWIMPWGNSGYLAHYHLPTYLGRHECWFVRHDSPIRNAVEEILVRHRAVTGEQYQASVAGAPSAGAAPTPRPPSHRNLLVRVAGVFSRTWHLLDE
jgi:hypothetical protein